MSESKMARREEQRPGNNQPIRVVAPPCDVYESAEEYLILADVPGAEDKGIDVRLDRSQLTIEAARAPDEGGTLVDSEYAPRRYRRTFQIPDSVNAAGINAELKNGVLALHLPKAPAARVRKIAVTAG